MEFVLAFEGAGDPEITVEELINGFAMLIKRGTLYSLQGFYGRYAAMLVERGFIDWDGNVLFIPED